jgi:probable DNA repair protein
VPHAFVQLSPELDRACRTALVLTPTERLRRNVVRAFNDARVAAGERAWPTPRVQTLESYLAILHERRVEADRALPRLLSLEAEFQLFRATAPAGATRLTRLAQEAWQLCHHWRIPVGSDGFAGTENGRVFAAWAERVRARLDEQSAITRAELPGQPDLTTPEPVLACLAFERTPRAFERWLERQRHGGCRVEVLENPGTGPAGATRIAFDSPAEELAAMAQWVRRRLEDRADDVRIGIVVPDLAARHQTVLRQLTAELDPMLEHGTQGLVDIAGGTALGAAPVWRAARDWLELRFAGLPADRARRCLNQPYLELPRLARLSPSLPPDVDLRILARQPGLESLAAHLDLPHDAQDRPAPFANWLARFQESLAAAGWDGRRAGSFQYQAWQDAHARLDALARTADQRPIGLSAALELLDHFLDGVTFAPERAPAPVQVMGYLETTGLDFSHLWVLGLDDRSWPRPPTLNPFLPVALRRAHGVPRTTPEDEAAFAAERLHGWLGSASTVVVSHARHDGESVLRPSALIRALPEATAVDLNPARAHPAFAHRHDQLENLPDTAGRPLPPGPRRGGSSRIRDQAICPFRGYAIHRLALAEPRLPHGLPNALDRGILVHEALHRLYDDATAAGRPPAALGPADFARAAAQALGRHYGRFPRPFRTREGHRLAALLEAWNRLEGAREDGVQIESLELGVEAEFDGIGLTLRIDRVDRIDDALVVVDYKTGRIGHRLNQERLVDPQLPLYALTNPRIEGVLYAEIDDRDPRLKGITALAVDQQADVEAPAGGSWVEQRRRWQRQIDTLTAEIRGGFAAVRPYETRACQTCHLQSFCRIDLDDGGSP